MPRGPKPTRLRENPRAAPPGARVIDVPYEVVGRKGRAPRPKPQRSFLGQVKWWFNAITTALIVGFLIPPAWLVLRAFLAVG